MTASSREIVTLDDPAPRRDAMRAIGAAASALLGAIGLGATARARAPRRTTGQSNARAKNKPGKCQLIGLTSAVSAPFSLGNNEGVTKQAVCPDGFVSINGGLQGASEVMAQCMIRESHPMPDGSAWVINVFCTTATNTPLRVGVICFSRNSFKPQGESDFLDLDR